MHRDPWDVGSEPHTHSCWQLATLLDGAREGGPGPQTLWRGEFWWHMWRASEKLWKADVDIAAAAAA